MAPASKEGTRKQRVQALNHLNAALEDFHNSRSRDVIDLDAVRLRMRAADVAFGRFVVLHNKFLDFPCEEAAIDTAQAEGTAAFKKVNTAKAQFLALKRAVSGLEPNDPLVESTRQHRAQALNHLNAAIEDLDGLRSRDVIDLSTVRLRLRAVDVAYARFVGWHNEFLDLHCEEAAIDAAQAENTTVFKKVNTAKARFLALKRAISGLDPSDPLVEITRQQRAQALSHLNAALEDLDKLKSQDAIDLNTVQA